MKGIKWIYTHLEEVLLCIFLTVIVLISGIQVLARYAFNNSLTWSEELCRYLYVWSGFLTVSYCIHNRSIIKIDTITMFLPETAQKLLDAITSVLSFIVIAFFLKASVGVVGNVIATGQLTPAMRIPIWTIYLCAPVGYSLVEIRLIQHLAQIVFHTSAKSSKEADEK